METTSVATCPWEEYLPDHVCLYYVDYNSNLDSDPKLIGECIEKNSLYPLSETVYDWWDFPEQEYLDQMQRDMENDDMEWDDDWRDEILDVIYERDNSDPIKDLIRNTSYFNCYYDLGYSQGTSWDADEEEEQEEIDAMCKLLNISKDSPMRKKITSIYHNATEGGRLRIYFPAELTQLISHNGYEPDPIDFGTIRFKGKFRVCVMNTWEGSGDFENDVELDVEYQFDRDCLGISELDHYGFEEVFGDDCLISNCESPKFIKETSETAIKVESEDLKAEREQERKYNETFAKGKCTCGDRDMKRHRDLEYIDSFPCGWRCPHCGMFWVD